MTSLQELERLLNRDLYIMVGDARTDLYTLYVLLLALLVLILLFRHVLMLAKIDNAAHWRLGVGSNHNQVKSFFLCLGEGGPTLHNAKLGAI